MNCSGCGQILLSHREAATICSSNAMEDAMWLCSECYPQVRGFIGALLVFNQRIRQKNPATPAPAQSTYTG